MWWFLMCGCFGVVIGTAAARQQGFSPAAGAFLGFVLGLFAPLLFYVPGPVRAQCPQCGEWTTRDGAVVVCRHCGGPMVGRVYTLSDGDGPAAPRLVPPVRPQHSGLERVVFSKGPWLR